MSKQVNKQKPPLHIDKNSICDFWGGSYLLTENVTWLSVKLQDVPIQFYWENTSKASDYNTDALFY